MKQINNCLNRFFENKRQLKQKWIAIKNTYNDMECLMLFHYQHLILVMRLDTNEIIYKWWECPTDKRGLDAAIEYLKNNKGAK
jgi:hypothetical protein